MSACAEAGGERRGGRCQRTCSQPSPLFQVVPRLCCCCLLLPCVQRRPSGIPEGGRGTGGKGAKQGQHGRASGEILGSSAHVIFFIFLDILTTKKGTCVHASGDKCTYLGALSNAAEGVGRRACGSLLQVGSKQGRRGASGHSMALAKQSAVRCRGRVQEEGLKTQVMVVREAKVWWWLYGVSNHRGRGRRRGDQV